MTARNITTRTEKELNKPIKQTKKLQRTEKSTLVCP